MAENSPRRVHRILNARPTRVKRRANTKGECFAEEIMDSLQKAPVCSSTGRMENILDEPLGGKGMRASRAGRIGNRVPHGAHLLISGEV